MLRNKHNEGSPKEQGNSMYLKRLENNILNRQQQLLKNCTEFFGVEINPIYKDIDLYEFLEKCLANAKILCPENNSNNIMSQSEEGIIDFLNPDYWKSIPRIVAEIISHIRTLNDFQLRILRLQDKGRISINLDIRSRCLSDAKDRIYDRSLNNNSLESIFPEYLKPIYLCFPYSFNRLEDPF